MPETQPRAQGPVRRMMHREMIPCFRAEWTNRGLAEPREPKPCTVAGPMTRYGQENHAPLCDSRMTAVEPLKPGIRTRTQLDKDPDGWRLTNKVNRPNREPNV